MKLFPRKAYNPGHPFLSTLIGILVVRRYLGPSVVEERRCVNDTIQLVKHPQLPFLLRFLFQLLDHVFRQPAATDMGKLV